MKKIPGVWASNDDYAAGHGSFTGQPTKIVPPSAVRQNGTVLLEPGSEQHLNHERNIVTENSGRIWTSGHLGFTQLPGTESDPTGGVQIGNDYFVVADGSVYRLGTSDTFMKDITPDSTVVQSIAYDPVLGNLVCVGAHATNMGSVSDDLGESWTAITDSIVDFSYVVWDDTNDLFIASAALTPWLMTSATGADASWTARTPGTEAVALNMASFGGQTVMFPTGSDTDVIVNNSDDGGLTWTTQAAAFTVTDAAEIAGIGIDPEGENFVVGIVDDAGAGDQPLEIYTSPLAGDGTVWTLAGSLTVGAEISLYKNMLGVTDTGNFIVASAQDGVATVRASVDGGVTFGTSVAMQEAAATNHARCQVLGSRIIVGVDDGTATLLHTNRLF